MKKLTKKEMLELLNDPEFRTLINSEKDPKKELAELTKAIEITDEDDLASLSRKQQAQTNKIIEYFSERLSATEQNAVDRATQRDRDRSENEIVEFTKTHPGMNNPEVVAMMQPRYDKGKPLADCYAVACRALELDPETGEVPDPEKAKKKEEEKPGDKKGKKDPPLKSSIRLQPKGEESDLDDEGKPKEVKPLTIEESLEANHNAFVAKHGDPFEDQS